MEVVVGGPPWPISAVAQPLGTHAPALDPESVSPPWGQVRPIRCARPVSTRAGPLTVLFSAVPQRLVQLCHEYLSSQYRQKQETWSVDYKEMTNACH